MRRFETSDKQNDRSGTAPDRLFAPEQVAPTDSVHRPTAGIHFTSSSELHTLGALYESMLREMRDAAGDSGEFYTPRPVVRFMVEMIDPRLGETVLDPASGTAGFLVEAFGHLSSQVKTVADRRRLQEGSILGCEAKSLPYPATPIRPILAGASPQQDAHMSNYAQFLLVRWHLHSNLYA
jgi:type I restriction-modification system DNA methylase subunit